MNLDDDDDDGAGGVREERMALLCAAGNTCTEIQGDGWTSTGGAR